MIEASDSESGTDLTVTLGLFFLLILQEKVNMDEECYPYYEPPVDYDDYDEYELSVYYLGDNIGMEEYDAED